VAEQQLLRITGLKLKQLADRIQRNHGAELTWEPAVGEAIVARCHEVDSGARNIDHIITQSLLPELASLVLEQMAAEQAFDEVKLFVDAHSGFRFSLHHSGARA
jgi:type VI secretion system protein VasG